MASEEDITKELEETFKDRYTENDEAYKSVLNEKDVPPPVITAFSSSSSDRYSRSESDGRKRSRSRSRSKSPSTLKRKGLYNCYSYFVYYY